MEGPVDGQRTDRPEPEPLDPGLQVEHERALDMGAVLQTGDGGDRGGDHRHGTAGGVRAGGGARLRGGGHEVSQLLRLPPTRALPAGMRIS